MAYFAVKKMDFRDWRRLQDEIFHLQLNLNAPHELMMFVVEYLDDDAQTVYLGLPDEVPLEFFPGFGVVDRHSLPRGLTTVVCREDGFKDRFPDIADKRIGKTQLRRFSKKSAA